MNELKQHISTWLHLKKHVGQNKASGEMIYKVPFLKFKYMYVKQN